MITTDRTVGKGEGAQYLCKFIVDVETKYVDKKESGMGARMLGMGAVCYKINQNPVLAMK